MSLDIAVSVYCLAYNHEKYIRKTLDGFIKQKTNFKYEVIVHDDASTDNTSQIIEEYAQKYPDIIKPIYQTENQYTKGIKIVSTYIYPLLRGKYIAICEGDDFWTDENKLQLQYDAMEKHPECSVCSHYVQLINVKNQKKGGCFPNKNYHLEEGVISKELQMEITISDFFHINSLFIRKKIWENYIKCPPKFVKFFPTGDCALLYYLIKYGKFYFINKTMSIYHAGVFGSWSCRIRNNKLKYIEHIQKFIFALRNCLNDFVELEAFQRLVEEHIKSMEFTIEVLKRNYKVIFAKENKEYFNGLSKKLKLKLRIGRIFPKLIDWYDKRKER